MGDPHTAWIRHLQPGQAPRFLRQRPVLCLDSLLLSPAATPLRCPSSFDARSGLRSQGWPPRSAWRPSSSSKSHQESVICFSPRLDIMMLTGLSWYRKLSSTWHFLYLVLESPVSLPPPSPFSTIRHHSTKPLPFLSASLLFSLFLASSGSYLQSQSEV